MAKRLQELQSHPLVGNVPETAIMLIKDNTTAPFYEDYKITFQDFTAKLVRQAETNTVPLVNQIPRMVEGVLGPVALPAVSAEFLTNVMEIVPVATDAIYGKVKLSASTSSTNGVSNGFAATPSAVKATYDAAAKKATAETITANWTFTGSPIYNGSITINRDSTHLNLGLADGVRKWHMEVKTDGTFNIVESDVGTRFTIAAGGAISLGAVTTPKVLLSAAQASEVNSATRKDYVDSKVTGAINGAAPVILTSGFKVTHEDISGTITNVISIGTQSGAPNGGIIVMGSGECVDDLLANYNHNSESTVIGADGDIFFHPNMQDGWATRKTVKFGIDGHIYVMDGTMKVYHTGFKPTYTDVGAAAASHTHDTKGNGWSVELGPNVDLNTMVTAGVWHQSANAEASTALNYPEPMAGSLQVYNHAGITQVYHLYNVNKKYTRSMYQNTWTAWSLSYNTAYKPTAADVGAIPSSQVAPAAILEAGKYIDMRETSVDFNTRLESKADTGLNILMGVSGVPVAIGCRNTSYAHFDTSATTGFYFYKLIDAQDVLVRSDKRLKSNFKEITTPLHKVCSLNGRIYNKKLSLTSEDIGDVEAGVIAQEVEAVLPEAVKTNKEEGNLKSVSPSAMIALLVEAVKELKAELDELKSQV